MRRTTLVMGASGFLGSHVTRQLVERGDDVRVWIRATSSTEAFDELRVTRVVGELSDVGALTDAMTGVDAVHYCIVDARAWLRDPAPLFATNVDALRTVLDAAVAAGVPKFVFCSTIGTLAVDDDRPVTEDDPHNWRALGGAYVESRIQAEDLVLAAGRDRGLPVVVLNVGTTYGPGDYGPTPHGKLLSLAARGLVPFYVVGNSMEIVGIEDAARAFLLAEERGRNGERYIVSEGFTPTRDVHRAAAEVGGALRPFVPVPMWLVTVAAYVAVGISVLIRRDLWINPVAARLMNLMTALDHGKATRELGWEPRPTLESVRAAATFFRGR